VNIDSKPIKTKDPYTGVAVAIMFRNKVTRTSRHVWKFLSELRWEVASRKVLSQDQVELLKGNDRLFNASELVC
jgi:hypothetical protein